MANNYVAKHNFNRGGAHQDQTKVIPRNAKYDDLDVMVEDSEDSKNKQGEEDG